MLETVFHTKDLPTAERLAQWRELTSRALVPTECVSDGSDFVAALRMVDFSAVQVTTMRLPEMRSFRSTRQIRTSDPDQFQLAIPVRGTYRFSQAGRETEIGPGDLMLYDSSRPFDSRTRPHGDHCEVIMAQFPKRALSLPPGRVASLVAVRSPGGDGMGALVSGHVRNLVRHQAHYGPADVARLGTVTLDLVAAWCAHVLDADRTLPPESRERALLATIHDFIEQHLADPALSPDAVAAAHHVSTRYLQRLFQQQGTTVTGWIRQRRLDRCRRDLADPALRSRPIHAVAGRWGFTDKSHFSRLFRAAFDAAPRDYRHRS